MTLVRIRDVVPLDGFKVRLTLTDGRVTERDLSTLLAGPIFEGVRSDYARFREVQVEGGTLVWPNGADLCPDVIIWGGPPPATPPALSPVVGDTSRPEGAAQPG